MTLSVESDVSPKIFFLYQTQTKQFVHLADIFPAVKAQDMAPMTPYTLTVRDGTSVPVYLTLPKQRQKRGGVTPRRATWGEGLLAIWRTCRIRCFASEARAGTDFLYMAISAGAWRCRTT